MGASPSVPDEVDRPPDMIPSTCTKDARHRDQPGLAFFAEAFAAGDDEAHLQRGCEPGVTMIDLPPAGQGGQFEDSGEAEWPLWHDAWSGESRGGAVAFVPADAGASSPCIYFVHGGGFEWGGPREDGYDSLCSRIARGTGQIVVCPDHPLSGNDRPFKAPAIIETLAKGLRWLVRFDPMTKERRKDAPQIVLCGDSAGATQAYSLLLHALLDESCELKNSLCGLVLFSPWLDLTCRSHTYVSNAFAAEANTGDLAFREHADENRAGFKGMGQTYTGTADLLKDSRFSPYWLSRGEPSDLLNRLQACQVPTWICTGASETLAGDFGMPM